jgi:acetylornithine deacetylase/succinyl-diaminopimelate desuccinylase-like protein
LNHAAVVPTPGHPIVYADWLDAPGSPTVLAYGHYDVQPVDPLSEWETPPFQPMVRGNNLFGRGTSDDKGQVFVHIKALEAYLQTEGQLPLNIKCLFEGEEEIGSPNLASFLTENREALRADVAIMSDTRMAGPDRPAITYALRGALSLELELRAGRHDLHSGVFGGAIHNPLQALGEIMAGLQDADGRICIPGFYRHVRKWGKPERAYMAQTGPSDAEILRNAGVLRPWGEPGYSMYERTTLRPSLAVTGILGGYQGIGSKAVIPARAIAKLYFRLVPDQDPEEIEQQFRDHIACVTPATMRFSIRKLFKARPVVMSRRHPALAAAIVGYREGFGNDPVFLRSGGSVPAVSLFQETFGVPTVLMGFALADDAMHAPNEKFHLPNFYNGIETMIRFLAEAGKRIRSKINQADEL